MTSEPVLPSDNPLTRSGVALGQMLFQRKLGRTSCGTCHSRDFSYSWRMNVRREFDGESVDRQVIPLVNLAWRAHGPGTGYGWSGDATTLRDMLAIHMERTEFMQAVVSEEVERLSGTPAISNATIRAFNVRALDSTLLLKALEQYVLSLTFFQSTYDLVMAGQASFTPAQQRGRDLFYRIPDPQGSVRGAACIQCHNGPNFSNYEYANNGLEDADHQGDRGRQSQTKDPKDAGRFLVPPLRQVAETGPFMHDGRFASLRDVVKHYNSGVRSGALVEGDLMRFYAQAGGLGLTDQEIDDIVAFLYTLTIPTPIE